MMKQSSKKGGGMNWYLGILLAGFLGSNPASAADIILAPAAPVVQPPPSQDEDGFSEILERRQERLKKETAAQNRKKPFNLSANIAALAKETAKPKPMKTQFSITLVAVSLKTSGAERRDYVADPAGLFHIYYRPSDVTFDNNYNFFTGLRVAPFGGTGIYKNHPARFGFVYFGPMVGVGNFSPVQPGNDDTATAAAVKPPLEVLHQYGWMWTAGVAAQSRYAAGVEGAPDPDDDFNNKGIAFDTPGVWTEFSLLALRYNVISWNFTTGVQMGKKKLFIYGGLGVGLWY